MKRLIPTLAALLIAINIWGIPEFSGETLRYKVMYKWGLINKKAGTATITIADRGDEYFARLTAASEPWADRFYTVRDTLNSRIRKAGLLPLHYEKIAHEGGEFKHDVVRFDYSGNHVTGHCTRRVVKKGKETVNPPLTLSAVGMTVDMLSSFYYMRSLNFQDMETGRGHSVTIFSGKHKETLTFRYHGIESLKLDGTTYSCYHVTFIFTGSGGKKTSDDMDAWITADGARIPVQLEGKLPVGKVRCQLIK